MFQYHARLPRHEQQSIANRLGIQSRHRRQTGRWTGRVDRWGLAVGAGDGSSTLNGLVEPIHSRNASSFWIGRGGMELDSIDTGESTERHLPSG